jgi:hypothetical protein
MDNERIKTDDGTTDLETHHYKINKAGLVFKGDINPSLTYKISFNFKDSAAYFLKVGYITTKITDNLSISVGRISAAAWVGLGTEGTLILYGNRPAAVKSYADDVFKNGITIDYNKGIHSLKFSNNNYETGNSHSKNLTDTAVSYIGKMKNFTLNFGHARLKKFGTTFGDRTTTGTEAVTDTYYALSLIYQNKNLTLAAGHNIYNSTIDKSESSTYADGKDTTTMFRADYKIGKFNNFIGYDIDTHDEGLIANNSEDFNENAIKFGTEYSPYKEVNYHAVFKRRSKEHDQAGIKPQSIRYILIGVSAAFSI